MEATTSEILTSKKEKEALRASLNSFERIIIGSTTRHEGQLYATRDITRENFPDWIFKSSATDTESENAINQVRAGKYIDSIMLMPINVENINTDLFYRLFLSESEHGEFPESIEFAIFDEDEKPHEEELRNLTIDEELRDYFELSEVTPKGTRLLIPKRRSS